MNAGIRALTGLRGAAACLALALSAGPSVTAWCLGTPALHWLGTVSYSIYLVHRPLEDLVRPALSTALGNLQVPHVFTASAAVMAALAILISGVTYRLVEEPGRLWSRRLLQPRPAPARDAPAPTLAGRFSA